MSREKVEHLSEGYDIIDVEEFEEEPIPRKLFRVALRKKSKKPNKQNAALPVLYNVLSFMFVAWKPGFCQSL